MGARFSAKKRERIPFGNERGQKCQDSFSMFVSRTTIPSALGAVASAQAVIVFRRVGIIFPNDVLIVVGRHWSLWAVLLLFFRRVYFH